MTKFDNLLINFDEWKKLNQKAHQSKLKFYECDIPNIRKLEEKLRNGSFEKLTNLYDDYVELLTSSQKKLKKAEKPCIIIFCSQNELERICQINGALVTNF